MFPFSWTFSLCPKTSVDRKWTFLLLIFMTRFCDIYDALDYRHCRLLNLRQCFCPCLLA
jgi:hypothetical protein